MTVAFCLDDNNGMMFNGRRQSRDRVLISDFVARAGNSRIWISPYSEILFEGRTVTVDRDFTAKAARDDFCFAEDTDPARYSKRADRIIIYRWNRSYPFDTVFDTGVLKDFRLESRTDFAGSSHERITAEVYLRAKNGG